MSKSKFELKCEIAAQILNGFLAGHGAAYRSMNLGNEGLKGYVNLSKVAADSLYDKMAGKAPEVKFEMPKPQTLHDNGKVS